MEYKQKSARLPRSTEEKVRWRRVIILLEHCPLQGIQTEKGFELVGERHRSYHAKHGNEPTEWRPEVVHQCLLQLQDSALNRAGMLQVFLRTKKGVCIAVDPRLRVPRHVRLFEKMIVTLLFKMKIRACSGPLALLRVVRNPITEHIPGNTQFIRVEQHRTGQSGNEKEEEKEAMPVSYVDAFALARTCGYEGREGTAAASKSSTTMTSSSGAAATTTTMGVARLAEAQDKAQFRPFAFIVSCMPRSDSHEVDYAPRSSTRRICLAHRLLPPSTIVSTLLHAFEEEWLREDNELD